MSYFDDHEPAPLVFLSVSSSSPKEYKVCPREFFMRLSRVEQLTVTGTVLISTLGSSGAFSLALRAFFFSFHSSSRLRARASSSSNWRFHTSTAFLHTDLPDACSPLIIDISPSFILVPSQYSTSTWSA